MTKFDRSVEAKFTLFNNTLNPVSELFIKNLRISFQVSKSSSWSTNTASVQIYNLNENKRSQIKDFGDDLRLSAGYVQDSGNQLLFKGSTTRVSHLFVQPDIITNIDCGDGERFLNQTFISISFNSGITARQALIQVAKRLNVKIAFFDKTDNLEYFQGKPFQGMAKDLIDSIAKYLRLNWSVQNGDLYFVNETTDKPSVIISQNTGMIGTPQRYTYKKLDLWKGATKQGYKVKTLLRPEILPLDKVTLISNKISVNQLFYVFNVRHSGDNYGAPWYSDFELIQV